MCLVELEEATRQRNIMSINSYFLRQSDIMPLKKNTVFPTPPRSPVGKLARLALELELKLTLAHLNLHIVRSLVRLQVTSPNFYKCTSRSQTGVKSA